MAILLSLYLGSFSFPFPFSDHMFYGDASLFSGFCLSFNGRTWVSPFSRTRCFSVEQELLPRPKLKPLNLDVDEKSKEHEEEEDEEEEEEEETQFIKPSSVYCSQIEKLVWCGRYREALQLFEILEYEGGHDVAYSTYDTLVSACIELQSVKGVRMLCDYMRSTGFEPDLYMRNRVLRMHVKCGLMDVAHKLFVEMPERDLVSWNTIIGGLVDSRNYVEAFRLFLLMWEEFSGTESDKLGTVMRTMILACTGLGVISVGRQLHSYALKMRLIENIPLSCVLIDMYIKCGSIYDARCTFNMMPVKNTVGWNSIISGYVLHGYSEEALSILCEMRDSGVRMDHFTFSIIVKACARLASLERAKQAHAGLLRHSFGLNIVANNALVDFYGKWGRIEDAQRVFEMMPHKDVKSWSSLIAGYANHGRGPEAVEIFERMLCAGMRPNHVTFLAVLSACSYSGLSKLGWEIFESMRVHKINPRAMHYACMIELLGREGRLDEACKLFKRPSCRPTENMWDALLTASRVHENLELGRFAAEKLYEMETEKLTNYIVLLNIYNSSGKLKEAAAVVQTLKRKGLQMLPACSCIETRKEHYAFVSGEKWHPQSKEIYQKLDELMTEISKQGYVPDEKFVLSDVDEQEKRLLLYHSEKLAIAFGLINSSYWTPLQVVQSHRICDDCHNAIKLIALVTKRLIRVKDASRFHHFKDGICSCGDYW